MTNNTPSFFSHFHSPPCKPTSCSSGLVHRMPAWQYSYQQEASISSPMPISLLSFHPNASLPKLRLFSQPSISSPLIAIIRLSALLLLHTDPCLEKGEQQGETWYFVHCCGQEGWVQLPADTEGALVRRNGYKRYEDWQGNNYFFGNGAIMLGSDLHIFLFCNVCIIVPTICFYIFVLPYMYERFIAYGVLSVLLILCLINLWLTSLTEPGILPRIPTNIKVS
jgi:hypothetical protein